MPTKSIQSPVSPAGRLVSVLVAAGSLGLLALAAALSPDGRGHGTHQQLGLPACGWVRLFDMPCPTCGMTTSFTHAANGDPIAAFAAQPAGTLLAITTAAVFFGSIHTALFGVRVGRLFRPLGGAKSIWIMIASLLLAWIYKILTW